MIYLPPTSSSPPHTVNNNLEDDSGFESLVTNVSDSGSLSSRLVVTSPASKERPEVSEPPYQNVGPAPAVLRWQPD